MWVEALAVEDSDDVELYPDMGFESRESANERD
jgi:hypothetical protein